MVTRALLALAAIGAAAGAAAAQPIADAWWRLDEQPPPPPLELAAPSPERPPEPPAPPPPRLRTFGWRYGMATMNFAGHRRLAAVLSLTGGLQVVGQLRGVVEYDLLLLMDASGTRMEEPRAHGLGHAGRLGLRHPLAAGRLGRGDERIRFYADAELTAGVALTDDNLIGGQVTPQGTIGARLGYEFLRGEPDPTGGPGRAARPRFDGHLVLRAIASAHDTTFFVGCGMEWGS